MPSGANLVLLDASSCLSSLDAWHAVVRLVVLWSSVRDGMWMVLRLYGLASSVLVHRTVYRIIPQLCSKRCLTTRAELGFLCCVPTWKELDPLVAYSLSMLLAGCWQDHELIHMSHGYLASMRCYCGPCGCTRALGCKTECRFRVSYPFWPSKSTMEHINSHERTLVQS